LSSFSAAYVGEGALIICSTMAFAPVLNSVPIAEAATAVRVVPRQMQQFVDDEMLRAPLLFDQMIESVTEHAMKDLSGMSPAQRAAIADMLQALKPQKHRLAEYFMRSLREQVKEELASDKLTKTVVAENTPGAAPGLKPLKALSLELVDEEAVALDVELAHVSELIKSVAEYELRELQTFTSALVGDMDVAADHNPFRAETYGRALWAAAQGLAMSRGHQVSFIRHAGPPLAQLLRKSYAASSSRLENMGVEPAAYRTMILPAGSRRGARFVETTFAPDLHRMRDTMPAELDETITQSPNKLAPVAAAATPHLVAVKNEARTERSGAAEPPERSARVRAPWAEVASMAATRADKQSIELVGRLFQAMVADERVPDDVRGLISLLQHPALRLMLRDASVLDQSKHPLWAFINRMAFEAEMVPAQNDPERTQLLKLANDIAQQLTSEPDQNAALYEWAQERLHTYVQMRLSRRVKAVSYRIEALQHLEDKLLASSAAPTTLHGLLDVPQLDTVPADLMDGFEPIKGASDEAKQWLDGLRPGQWVRMFLQGRWVHAQLLWPGERGEVWLFGNGNTHANHATWAVRRGALLMMKENMLAKTLKQRSFVGSAAARVQKQLAQAEAA
jgi:Protein of unknown function (DUF1631)